MSKMKNCKHCGTEVAKSAKVCPKCGGKLGIPKFVIFLIVIVVIIVGSLAAKDGATGENKEKEKFSYEITKQYADEFKFGYYIEGTVKNNRDKDYSYVQIEFICYDASGNNLGTAVDNTNNLLGGQTWKYKALALTTAENIDHCEYHEITGW